MDRATLASMFAVFVVFFLGFLYAYLTDESEIYKYWEPQISGENVTLNSAETNKSSGNILLDFCDLTDLDPWDPTISAFIWQQEDPALKCKPKVKQITHLIDGQLFLSPQSSNVACLWRCLYPKDDYSINFDEWNKLVNGSKPFCDIVEVECQSLPSTSKFYKFLHAQTFRLDAKLSSRESPSKYDVHIILFDSVSESQFVRSMPKTRHVLREYYESISFRHLNKIGLNSRPNGFGLLLGKSIYSIPKSPISRGHHADYFGESFNSSCKSYLDDDQFIGFRFKDDDYVTMMSEDWALGVFNWPDCLGFENKPVDHYMRPFQLRVEAKNRLYKSPRMSQIVYGESCRETFYYQFEYLKDFLKTYPDKPKFSLTWLSYLTHDDQNALSHADDYFYHFFNSSRADLDNSFLFVMGDHGNRFGKVRQTNVGEIEDNNPFLFLSVPKDLRRNESLINNLKENSKELITHYDIYATMVGITNPSNPRTPEPLIKGSSLFDPLPQPRTCDRLRIPFEYCICKATKTRLPKNNEIALPAAKLLVAQMNLDLLKYPETSVCTSLTLDENARIYVDEFDDKNDNERIFKVTFSTLPGNGLFWAMVSQDSNDNSNGTVKILSDKFPRMDAYGPQAYCVERGFYASYCYCKDLLKGKNIVK